MKKIYMKWLAVAGLASLLFSCKSDLETEPIELQTLDQIFNSKDSAGVNAERFLLDIYTRLPRTYNRVGDDYLDASTDDAISSNPANVSVLQLAQGLNTSENYQDNQWANCYSGIRQVNIFINNIDNVPLKGKLANGTGFNAVWKSEARFLRALYYFELVKRHAGVPLLGDRVFQLGDDIELPRNSFEECVNYIVSECDAIKNTLRTNPFDLNFIERPTKGAALALKARVLLYAASPLYNGGNIDASNPLTGYTNFSAERWQKAEQAALELIDINQFELLDDFKSVFITQGNKERIFSRQGGTNVNIETANGPIGYTTVVNNGRTSPTQELVDAFGMANGLPITDQASNYQEDNPYAGRDPRFYATVFHNGSQWLGRQVQTYEGGADKPGGSKQQTRTGYYARKFMGNFESLLRYDDVNHDFILFRYAEVLLNYAEARNEFLDAPDEEVYQNVEAIRERAGLNPFQLPSGLTKVQMRDIIQNERRKELAFEEHRFYDVRRWKQAEDLFNKQVHGMTIYKTGTGTIYQEVPVLQLNFNKKMYLAPIPFYEVIKNRKMVQNPGW
ncbi:RagB/SusD family nutrient uptake outer membrane protein [Desertivirga xinjiangensis]|uniref:RagB/SusD family nutrient uptake outer membrane protein n=1 Tax=Desertivirga xinjiangensis TaxID=539206 RepID=UPI00210E26E0|nr:RagB/SusD family nutrient uptake outer membrane protein [Pedobacter xinjiangensis]